MEWCNQSGSIKYLFTYISKGQDRVTIAIEDPNKDGAIENGSATTSKSVEKKNEIKDFFNCRLILYIFESV